MTGGVPEPSYLGFPLLQLIGMVPIDGKLKSLCISGALPMMSTISEEGPNLCLLFISDQFIAKVRLQTNDMIRYLQLPQRISNQTMPSLHYGG